MLIRCPNCNQLFPKHHGQHRECKGGGGTSPSTSKMTPTTGESGVPDLRARMQARFNQKPTPSVPSPTASVAPKQEPDLDLEVSDVPSAKPKSSDELSMESWTPENGGLCPRCDAYNPGYNVFCGSCEAMLIKSDAVELELETSYPLKEIRGLVHTFVEKLEKYKVKTTEDVLRVCVRRKNREMLAKHTGMSERSLFKLAHTSNLCRIPSINSEQVAMLEMIAISTLDDLLKYKPADLSKKLEMNRMQINRQGIMFFPTKNKIALWLEEARALEPIKIDP